MSLFLTGSLIALAIYFGMGFAFQYLGENRNPIRRYSDHTNVKLDSMMFVLVVAERTTLVAVMDPFLGRLKEVSGFRWMGSVAHFVDTQVPWPIAFLVFLVVADFLVYWGHRLLHTRLFWHGHAVHHSPKHLYWFAGIRATPIHLFLVGIGPGLFAVMWPFHGGVVGFFVGTIQGIFTQHFVHANVRWDLGPLKRVFVTPRMHFVHHGADMSLNGTNFGNVFSFWDRMFGTYQDPDRVPDDFPLGLNYENSIPRLIACLPPPSRGAGKSDA